MLYTVSADALQRFRLMLDTPAHEGVERGRAAVQGGHGGAQRRANGDGGGPGLGGEPANDACVAGALRGSGHGGDGQPVSPADPLPTPDAGPDRGAGAGDAALQAVLGPASTGPGAGQERRDPDPVGLRDLSLSAPGGLDPTGSEAVAAGGLETLGAGRGDGAVAAGRGRWLSSRRWHHGQGPDRAGRPLVHGRGLLEPLRMPNSGRDLTPGQAPALCFSLRSVCRLRRSGFAPASPLPPWARAPSIRRSRNERRCSLSRPPWAALTCGSSYPTVAPGESTCPGARSARPSP